jgi:hypothetical protein
MAGTYTPTGTYANLTRLELEQLRRGDFTAGGKALTIGDSALAPEGVVGKGDVTAEVFYTTPSLSLSEVNSLTPPSEPGKFLGNDNTYKDLTLYVSGGSAGAGGQWVGPTEISFGAAGVGTATTAGSVLTDIAASFIVDGVLPGDLLLIEHSSAPTTNNFSTAIVSVVGATTLTCTNIVRGGLPVATFIGAQIELYQVVRAGAVALFAVPGSGPTGEEQTFLFVDSASTLNSNPSPTTDDINADRLKNIISPKYGLNASVDRADAVFGFPAPHTDLSGLGYRVVLYPDNGTGTGPNLAAPITSLNPLIDPGIPAADQRVTIDYAAGTVRLSCAPKLGGQIKVAGGVDGVTGRLKLYAVYWVNVSQTGGPTFYDVRSTAAGLFTRTSDPVTVTPPAWMQWFGGSTRSWTLLGHSVTGGVTSQSQVRVSGFVAEADATLQVLGVDQQFNTSLVKKANAGLFTCGDGVKSFGDFNGATALEQAISFWISTASLNNSLTIYLKGGAYTLGNSNFNIPAGKEVIIRGEGREATRILFDGGSVITTCIGVNAGSRLHLADLAIRYGAGGYLSAQGSVSADNCLFESITISYSNATPYKAATTGPFPFLGLFTNCEFNNAISNPFPATPRCAVSIYASGTSMKGFVFRNCTMRSADAGGTVVYVTTFGAGSLAATVSDLAFENCVIDLATVDSTSSTAISGPAGVVSVDPELTVDKLTLDLVRFTDCTVSAVVGAARANTVLLHLMPLPFDAANTTAERAIIGTVKISGGIWSVPAFNGTDFSPFFLACCFPIVENVVFRGAGQETQAFNTSPGYRGNGLLTDTQRICLKGNTANYPTNQSKFATIAASGQAVYATIAGGVPLAKLHTGMTIRGVQFDNFHRKAGPSGVLLVIGPDIKSGAADVDGIHVRGIPGATGVGNLVDAWMLFIPGGDAGSTSRGTNGTFRNITFSALVETPATTDTWTNRGFIRIIPEGRMYFEDITITPTKQGLFGSVDGPIGISAPAINLNYPFGGDNIFTPGGPISLNRVRIENWTAGIWWNQNPVTIHAIGPFIIKALHHVCSNVGNGISVNQSIAFNQGSAAASGYTIQGIAIEDCQIFVTYDLAQAQIGTIFLQSSTWSRNFPCFLKNNHVEDNWPASAVYVAGSYQIAVMSFDVASSTPNFNIIGNTLVRKNLSFPSGLLGLCRLQQGASLALTTNTKYGGTSAFYTNAQTGHSIVDTDKFLFANTFDMECNMAQLATA